MRAARARAQRGRVRRRCGRRAAAAAQHLTFPHTSRRGGSRVWSARQAGPTPCAPLEGFSVRRRAKGRPLRPPPRYTVRRETFGLLNHARGPGVVIPRTARVSRRLRSWRAAPTRVRQRPRSTASPRPEDERRSFCRGACAARRPAQGAPASSRTRASARSLHASQIFIAAGEPSGDVLAARVMAALRAAAPCAVDFCGVGGCARLPSCSRGCVF